jgi:hypothetical protein
MHHYPDVQMQRPYRSQLSALGMTLRLDSGWVEKWNALWLNSNT